MLNYYNDNIIDSFAVSDLIMQYTMHPLQFERRTKYILRQTYKINVKYRNDGVITLFCLLGLF